MSRHLLLVAMLVAVAAPARAEFDYRSIFVDRFDYTYNSGNIPAMVSGINAVMENSANLGFKHVIFQVRGRGDALYNSSFEPDAAGLTPGFDPLQTAIDAAHARGLKLHAWINATPLWNGTTTPPPGHMFHNTDPSFRLTDINGNVEPASGWSNYSSVNPVLSEVHAHINNVVNDIATSYDVDGIHLDYIRFIPGALSTTRLPHDPISHQMFAQTSGGLDGGDPANFPAYKNYVKGHITDLVASIKQTVDAAEASEGRVMELTASVWRDPDVGENDYMQDYRTWLEQDLLDVAMPMIYLRASNDSLFNPNLMNTLNIPTNAKVAPTLGVYLHNVDQGGVELTASQMQRAYDFGADGVGFYDYPAVFNDTLAANTGLAPARREAIANFFDSIDNPPPPPPPPLPGAPGNILDDFEVDEGRFHWPYNLSPVSQTFGLATSTTIERDTNEAQKGQGSQLLNLVSDGSGNWQLRHNSGTTTAAVPAANVPLVATGSVGFWLKTDDPNMTVRIAIDDPVGNTALERGTPLDVVADNQWHLYQWSLEDDDQWHAFAGGANGVIDAVAGTVTIDSIWIAGSGDVQIYLDTVSHNPNGLLAAVAMPGDFNGDGSVDADDLIVWQAGNGMPEGATYQHGDADGDGDVDGGDFLAWQRNLGPHVASTDAGAAVPEPAAAWLAGLLAAVLLWYAMLDTRRMARAVRRSR